MFSGIIEATGLVRRLERRPDGGALLVLEVSALGEPLTLGESLAVNGCCLTVAERWPERGEVGFDLLRQTMEVTNLGDLREGDEANLERALLASARLSGHFVQGHVDETATILAAEARGQDYRLDVVLPESGRRLLIPKGSIALDGISLTVAELAEDRFTVWIIPHTLAVTNLGRRKIGQRVNLEYDILGKYVRRMWECQGRA